MEGCKPRFCCVGPNPQILPHEQVGVNNLIHEGYSMVNFLQKESIMPCLSHRVSILVLQVTSLFGCGVLDCEHTPFLELHRDSLLMETGSQFHHWPLSPPKDASCMPDGSLDTTGKIGRAS